MEARWGLVSSWIKEQRPKIAPANARSETVKTNGMLRWETRRVPGLAAERRTFAIVTCPPNDLVSQIHDRMPMILHERDYARGLNDDETSPDDLMVQFPSHLMAIWPVSTRVNRAGNEGADLLDPIEPEEPQLF